MDSEADLAATPTTRIHVVEHLRPQASAPRSPVQIAFYPGRIERSAEPPQLSPSKAVRFAEDPARILAAADTGQERTVVAEPARREVPRSAPPAVLPEPAPPAAAPLAAAPPAAAAQTAPVAPAPARGPTSNPAPGPAQPPDQAVEPPAATSAGERPARVWSVPLTTGHQPPHRSWWRRLLRLGPGS